MKQLEIIPDTVQHIHSVDYFRGTERHRVVTRVHDNGVSVTVFRLDCPTGPKNQAIWATSSFDSSLPDAENFSIVNSRTLR